MSAGVEGAGPQQGAASPWREHTNPARQRSRAAPSPRQPCQHTLSSSWAFCRLAAASACSQASRRRPLPPPVLRRKARTSGSSSCCCCCGECCCGCCGRCCCRDGECPSCCVLSRCCCRDRLRGRCCCSPVEAAACCCLTGGQSGAETTEVVPLPPPLLPLSSWPGPRAAASRAGAAAAAAAAAAPFWRRSRLARGSGCALMVSASARRAPRRPRTRLASGDCMARWRRRLQAGRQAGSERWCGAGFKVQNCQACSAVGRVHASRQCEAGSQRSVRGFLRPHKVHISHCDSVPSAFRHPSGHSVQSTAGCSVQRAAQHDSAPPGHR